MFNLFIHYPRLSQHAVAVRVASPLRVGCASAPVHLTENKQKIRVAAAKMATIIGSHTESDLPRVLDTTAFIDARGPEVTNSPANQTGSHTRAA